MATDSAGYHAALETYTGDGTQSLLVTDKLDTNTRSVFWNDNDTTKQIIHGSVLSELLTASTSKGGTWGGHQTFSIDPETDCIGDLYLSITLNLNVPDSPLDTELNPKTLTTLLQKPSSRDALNDSSKTEPIGWQIRGIGPGDTLPKAGYIGTPNGWSHLKTDANDLGSGYMYSDSGMDGVDNYGLPSEAVSLSYNDPSSSPWGVGPDSAPRAQAWEDIEDVLKKDIDLFKVNDFNCTETYLDPSDTQEVIFQRNKDAGIGEFLTEDQGRTASDCYAENSSFIKAIDRVRSFNVVDRYYHTGTRNKFTDEFADPGTSDQNSFTLSSLFNDEKLKDVINVDIAGLNLLNSGAPTETFQISATFPKTVGISQLQGKLLSYSTKLSETMNTVGIDNNYGAWTGNVQATVVNSPNLNWDYWLGRPGADLSVTWNIASLVSPFPKHPNVIQSMLVSPDAGQPYLNTELLDKYCVNLSKIFSTYSMNSTLNTSVVGTYNNWPGNIRHFTSAASQMGFRNVYDVNEDILMGNISLGTKLASLNTDSRKSMSLYEDSAALAFEPYPGQRLITCKVIDLGGNRLLLFEFWNPATLGGIDITPSQLNDYKECTEAILSDLQDRSTGVNNHAPEPTIFFDLTSQTGNTKIILSKIMHLTSPLSQITTGIGDYIGTGPEGSVMTGEDDVQFNLSINHGFRHPISSYSPWLPPNVTNPPPAPGFRPRSRITTKIPQSIYTINDINSLGLGPLYAQNFTKSLQLYSLYKNYGTFDGVVSYISANEIDTEFIELAFELDFGIDFTKWISVIIKTLFDIVYEIISPPPSLSTIKNKKGHDNIISPSLIPSIDHPTVNPYTYSYLPKYLNHTESEEIKKIGTEYIDLKSDGKYCVYRSTDVLASDLFVSYLSKTDIINLVNHYNNKNSSVYPLPPTIRDIPAYYENSPPPDGTEISYVQKIEAVEDPPKRPDNLVFYQSDYNGFCTKLSSDGNTYAVSQGRLYGDASEAAVSATKRRVRRPGLVRVYKKENGQWVLNKIFRAPDNKLTEMPRGHMWNVSNGYNSHVDLSADGNRIVIGAAGGKNNYFNTYDYDVNTSTWTSVSENSFGPPQTVVSEGSGNDEIANGNLPSDYTFGSEFGSTISLSADGNRIVLTIIDSSNPQWAKRHGVKIFDWVGLHGNGSWALTPYVHSHEIIDISTPGSIALSGDGKTYVIGNPVPNVDSVYYITVGLDSEERFTLTEMGSTGGESAPPIIVSKGSTYVFDWSGVSGHMLVLSETIDGHHTPGGIALTQTSNITTDTGSYTTTLVAVEDITLYYYCYQHPNAGGKIAYSTPGNGVNIYRLYDDPLQGFTQLWFLIGHRAGDRQAARGGDAKSVTINYDGTRFATGDVNYDTGSGGIHIYHENNPGTSDYYNNPPMWDLVYSQYGDQNSFLGYSLAFNKDGTKLAAGSPYGFSDKNPIKKTISRDVTNFLSTSSQSGRLGAIFDKHDSGDLFEPEFSQDENAKYIRDRGGNFYDTKVGWRPGHGLEANNDASLGMRSERQRVANGEVKLYEYISGAWESVLEMDSSSGERNKTDKKSWPGTYGKYGTYKGTADGLGISVSMDGEGNNILAGAPLMSTIGKLQEQLDWYPGGGMTAAYSIHEEGGTAKIEDGDPVSSVLMADKSLRSHTRDTEEEVGRSYMFTVGKYTHSPAYPTPRKTEGARTMEFTDGYNIVNDAQVRINHDITDFINLPEIGEPIRWDKQFASVPGNAIYPPLRGDYQRPEWADSDLKSKVKFPILGVIKKVEILVDEKVWQTLEQADLLAIYSTEMSESSYNLIGSNSSGRLRSDGTRQAKNNGRWIPGKKYTLSIPIPGFTSGVKSGFNNFTQQTECGFLAGLTDSSNFKVKVYYNDLENVWDINNVSAMQGYTAPIYSTPHVTNLLETGANSSYLITDGARYETIGKSSGNGLYVTNVLEPWTPGITFDIKMYGQKIILHKDELKLLKTTIGGITKKINISKNVNNSFLNVSSKKPINIDLDSVSMYASHLIINLQYTNPNDTLYLKTAQLFLNAKPFSILDGGFMRGISNRSLGLYNNEYAINYNNLDPSGGNYVFPMANKAFGGSSVQFDKFDSIRLELIFENSNDIDSAQILADNININVTVRGLSSIKYKDGISSLLN